MQTKKHEILGLPIDSLTMNQSVERCDELIRERGHQHVVVNAAKAVMADRDTTLSGIIRNCALINADGQSIVWASKLLRRGLPERVAGIDLMERLLQLAPERSYSVYLLGATEEVVRKVQRTFADRGVHVVGARNGFWAPDEEHEVVDDIAALSPDILFVAMPSPRKEFFLAQNLERLNVGLAFGVGGSFDIVAGKTRRAPLWMQKMGLEWFYRFLEEPRRMFKRYLIGNIRFLLLVSKFLLQRRK